MGLYCNAEATGALGGGLGAFDRVIVVDRGGMAEAAHRARATLAVSDMMVVPGLRNVARRRVLILRETPEDRIPKLALEGGVAWDRIIVPNPANHWIPPRHAVLSCKVDSVGWIARKTTPRRPDDTPVGVLLATGGGGTPETRAALYPVLSRVIRMAQSKVPFRLNQALGPRAAGEALPEADQLLDPGSRLDALFQRADVVLSTAGYNSVLELAGTDTPALLAAIPRSFDDQQARVRQWGPGLGHGLEPGQEQAAADWLADRVAHPRRRPPVDLGPDGAVRAAELLSMLA
ncbi:hypothetical protein [Tropicibacter sp. S64]|uniref:hypothetical protein n=1 Tax=Tropicibacter sp. S64 TaxID=3415122 RepID=UPI003C7EBD12